jgi:hypothetical protein
MLFYRTVCIAFFLTFLVFVAATDHHSNVNWAFRNRHSIRDEEYPCDRDMGSSKSSDSISTEISTHLNVSTEISTHLNVSTEISTHLNVSTEISTHLNVSTTLYVSMEQIEVTWTPILNSCKDDFIGIYFAETPTLTGILVIIKITSLR